MRSGRPHSPKQWQRAEQSENAPRFSIRRTGCRATGKSNQGTTEVPFQRWFRFKEAFSPKFVIDTLASLDGPVEHCLDPFGGSGTTALTCRMLGLSSTSIEVNPFLADLIEAKIEPVSSSAFLGDYEDLLRGTGGGHRLGARHAGHIRTPRGERSSRFQH